MFSRARFEDGDKRAVLINEISERVAELAAFLEDFLRGGRFSLSSSLSEEGPSHLSSTDEEIEAHVGSTVKGS